MHGNMVFSTHYILGTPQQSGGFLVCSVNDITRFYEISWNYPKISWTYHKSRETWIRLSGTSETQRETYYVCNLKLIMFVII